MTFETSLSETDLRVRLKTLIRTGRGVLVSSGLEGLEGPGKFRVRLYRAPLNKHPMRFWVYGVYRPRADGGCELELRASGVSHLVLGFLFAGFLAWGGVMGELALLPLALIVAVVNWPLLALQFRWTVGKLMLRLHAALT